jgi:hypothetical protein
MEVTQGSEENLELLLNVFPQCEWIEGPPLEFEPVLFVRGQFRPLHQSLIRRLQWFVAAPVAAAQLLFALQFEGRPEVGDGSAVAWGWYEDCCEVWVPEALSGVTAVSGGYFHTLALPGSPAFLAARSGIDGLILSWPTNTGGFTLQTTLDLTPPVMWKDTSNLPAVVGTQFIVTNSFTNAWQFYRLVRP